MRAALFVLFALLTLALPGCIAMTCVPVGPPIKGEPRPGVEVVRFPTSDGLSLEGRFYPPDRDAPKLPDRHARAIVLFCHGVEDNAAHTEQADAFLSAGYRLFVFDYRGFGNSDRADSSNQGFADDAAAALRYLRTRDDVDPNQIIIYGHSMGGVYAMAAGASAWAEGKPVPGVVTGSAFSNWRCVSNDLFPVVGYLIGGVSGPEPTDFASKLGKTPLLLVHTQDDEIPVSHAAALMGAACKASVPVELYIAGYGGHVLAYWFNEGLRSTMTRWAAERLDGAPRDGLDWLPPTK